MMLAHEAKTLSRGTGNVMRNGEIQAAWDALSCRCGHVNVSHGYGDHEGPTWPDGSRVGLGPCGIDLDTRTHAEGWLGDRCPCARFTEADPQDAT